MQLFPLKFAAKLFHRWTSHNLIQSCVKFICGAHPEESTSDAFVLVEIQGTLQVKAPEY